MPDEARVMLGLAPAEVTISAFRAPGQRGTTTSDPAAVTTGWHRPGEADRPLSRWLMNHQYEVDHGPIGVGIEIMTYIADHYRPPSLRAAVGVFGRPNVVRNPDYVLVLGGGHGTLDEVDLAVSMGKKIIPYGATCGAARSALDRMRTDLELWVRDSEHKSQVFKLRALVVPG
jgi:hypothetical protein